MRYPLDKIYITNQFGTAGATAWYSFHNGVDLRASIGTSVYAPESGTAKKVTSDAGGNGLELKTNTGTHIFWHLSKITRVGDVNEGDRIALSGNTGKWTTAAHLHWGLKINGVYKDPIKIMEGVNMSCETDLAAMKKDRDVQYAERMAITRLWRAEQQVVANMQVVVDNLEKKVNALETDDLEDERVKKELQEQITELQKQLDSTKEVDKEEVVTNWFVELLNKIFRRE